MRRIAYLLLPLAVASCGAPVENATETGAEALGSSRGDTARRKPATSYVDLLDYASRQEGGAERYFAVVASLEKGFDDICGDTFCEGDYANLQSLRFRCSVAEKGGRIGQCLWVFAGSYEEIDPKSGAIEVNSKTFPCAIPVTATGDELLSTLADAGSDALYAPLPGGTASVYDALGACL